MKALLLGDSIVSFDIRVTGALHAQNISKGTAAGDIDC